MDFAHKLCVMENKEFDETVNPDYPLTPRGEEGFKANIGSGGALTLVAEVGGKIAGYLTGGPVKVEDYRTVKNLYELWSVWIEDDCRGKGMGKALLRKFEEWSKQRGAVRMKVEASAANKRAIDFYRKEGFHDYDLVLEKDLN